VDKRAIKQQILAKYPKLARADLLDRSIPAEYAVQLQALPPAAAPEGQGLPSTAPTTPTAGAATNAPAAPATTEKPGEAKNDDLLNTDTKKPKKGKKKK